MSYFYELYVCEPGDESYPANASSSTYDSLLLNKGDTTRILQQRVIASATSSGRLGEYCFGVDGGVPYLYYCVENDSWVRVGFSSW